MCLAFVEGDQRPLAACGDVDLEALGRVVASVHELPVAPLQGVLADPGTIAGYLDSRLEVAAGRLSFVRAPLSADVQHRVRRTWRLVDERAATIRNRPVAASAAAARLLHGDVSGGNVIWSPEPVLIDWEFARLGDPADEIASMFGQHELGSSPREAFWRGYGLRAGAHVVADLRPRVVAWEPVTLFGSALWWLERWTRRAEADRSGEVDAEASRREDHYRDNALRRLDRVEQLLAAVW
jgi:aminoglycoside phosphotransferase (APT) family kinase protein